MLLIATTMWYSGFCLLSFVTRFACDIDQFANIWIWVLIWGHCHVHSEDNLPACWLLYCLLLHRADETQPSRNSCPRLQFLAFSLDSVVVPLNFPLNHASRRIFFTNHVSREKEVFSALKASFKEELCRVNHKNASAMWPLTRKPTLRYSFESRWTHSKWTSLRTGWKKRIPRIAFPLVTILLSVLPDLPRPRPQLASSHQVYSDPAGACSQATSERIIRMFQDILRPLGSILELKTTEYKPIQWNTNCEGKCEGFMRCVGRWELMRWLAT